MNLNRLLRTAAAVLIAAACASPTAGGPGDGRDLALTRLSAGPQSFAYNSGLTTSTRQVIRDVATWQSTWTEIYRGRSPVPPLPQVDFSREMIVLAALGQRPSGGYGIYLDAGYQYADHLQLVVRSVSPGARCGTTQALTQPVDVALVPASDLPVQFVERSGTVSC